MQDSVHTLLALLLWPYDKLDCHRGSAQWDKATRLMASKQSDQGRDGRCHNLQEHVPDDLKTSHSIHNFKVSASSQLFHPETKHLTHEILMCLKHIKHSLTNCGRQPGWGSWRRLPWGARIAWRLKYTQWDQIAVVQISAHSSVNIQCWVYYSTSVLSLLIWKMKNTVGPTLQECYDNEWVWTLCTGAQQTVKST